MPAVVTEHRIVVILYDDQKGYFVIVHDPSNPMTKEVMRERIEALGRLIIKPKQLTRFRHASTIYRGVERSYYVAKVSLPKHFYGLEQIGDQEGKFTQSIGRPELHQLEAALGEAVAELQSSNQQSSFAVTSAA